MRPYAQVSHLEDLVGRAPHARPAGHGAGLDPLQLPQERLVAGGRRGRAVRQTAALQRAADAGAGPDAVKKCRRTAVGSGPAAA